MTQARMQQSPKQLLALAKSNQWEAIQPVEDALVNAAVVFKSFPLLESIIQKEYDVALRRALVGKAPATLIAMLIPRRKNINSGSSKQHNRTALHFAAQFGRTDIIPKMLEAGAYVNMIDETHFTPAHLACQQGHSQAALLLSQAGAYTVGDVSPSSLIPAAKRIEFSAYGFQSQLLVRIKIGLPSGLNTKYKTLIEPNNLLADFNVRAHVAPQDDFQNAAPEGMRSEGRFDSYEKIIQICEMRNILTLTVREYIDLDKKYCDVMPMHITQMLLRFGTANNDNQLASCSKLQMTKVTNLAMQWADLESLSETKFSLTFRANGMDTFFLLSDAEDLVCDSKYIRKAQDGKLIIDDKNLRDAIEDLANNPIQKPAAAEQSALQQVRRLG